MLLETVHDPLHLPHPKRSFVQYRVERPGAITAIGRRLSVGTRYDCTVLSISSAGALISLSDAARLPENFYLEILGVRDEIPCTEVKRDGDTLVVRFNMFLDPDFLDLVRGMKVDANGP